MAKNHAVFCHKLKIHAFEKEKKMQIFTSYFANLKKLPPDTVPISIALKTPAWFSGMRYAPLAPTGEILSSWKVHRDNNLYLRQYNQTVLSRLDPMKVRKDLERLSGEKEVFLLCYERPEDFCHRHRVAEWFSLCGIPVREWGEEKKEEWEQLRLL